MPARFNAFYEFWKYVILSGQSGVMPIVKCPNCGKEAEYEGNEFRPFCSERCKLIDFGAWADEEYTLPVENSEITEEDIEEIEKALARKTEE